MSQNKTTWVVIYITYCGLKSRTFSPAPQENPIENIRIWKDGSKKKLKFSKQRLYAPQRLKKQHKMRNTNARTKNSTKHYTITQYRTILGGCNRGRPKKRLLDDIQKRLRLTEHDDSKRRTGRIVQDKLK